MRISVRSQEGPKLMELTAHDLSRAITDGIRGAEIVNGINAHRRALQRLKDADEATGGAICKNIEELIKAEAAIVGEALNGTINPDIKAVRTEIGRLEAYIRYRDLCHEPPTGQG